MIRFDIRNYWSGAVQFTAEIDCKDDELTSIKVGLAVKWAFKTGARLDGASLVGASLVGASLVGASLDGYTLGKGQSWAALGWPDGWFAYTFFTKEGEQRVQVGCQNKTIAEGRKYWADKKDRREVLAAMDYAEAIAKARGWVKN